MRKIVLVASGDYKFEYQYNKNDFIVAIDGGYNYLSEQNIKPNLFIGDMDSLNKQIDKSVEIIKLPTEKDDTDALFAIKEMIKRGYNNYELYGFLGGDLSHTIANIQLFLFLKKQKINFKAIYQNHIYQVINQETISLNGKGYISIFSLVDQSIVTIKNLKYEITNYKLTNSYPLGIDNEFINNKKAKIKCYEGYILIIYSK